MRSQTRSTYTAIRDALGQRGSGITPPSRKAVLKRLQPMAGSQNCPLDLSRAMVKYTMHLLVNGTPKRKRPKLSTVGTYLSEMAPGLVAFPDLADAPDLLDLEPGDFEAAYLQMLSRRQEGLSIRTGETRERKETDPPPATARCATQLRHWHDWLEAQGVPPIDTTIFSPYLRNVFNRRHLDLVTTTEYANAMSWLAAQSRDSGPNVHHAPWCRRCDRAAVAIILLWHSGARYMEIAQLRHRDIVRQDGIYRLYIRSTRQRGLKRSHSRRRIYLSALTKHDEAVLDDWCTTTRDRLDHDDSTEPFLEMPYADSSVFKPNLRMDIQTAFQVGAGRAMWPHLLRHGHATRAIDTAYGTGLGDKPELHRTVCGIRHTMGHSRITTTVTHYLHMDLPAELSGAFDRHTLTALSGEPIERVDQVGTRRRTNRTDDRDGSRWLAALFHRCAKNVPRGAVNALIVWPPPGSPELPASTMKLVDLDRLLHTLVCAGKQHPRIATRYGVRPEALKAITLASVEIADLCHYRVLPGLTARGTQRVDQYPRTHHGTAMLDCADLLSVPEQRAITSAFLRCYSPTAAKHRRYTGSPEDIALLQRYHDAANVQTVRHSDRELEVTPPSNGGLSPYRESVRALAVLSLAMRVCR